MINYYYSKSGNFSQPEFQSEIDKAIKLISQFEQISENGVEMVRYSENIAFTTSGKTYSGTYITHKITKSDKILGELDCFLDNQQIFIEISTLTAE